MIRKLTLGLLGAATLLAAGMACAQVDRDPPPPQVTFLKSEHTIPFTLFRGNRIVIPASINGHATEFLLDTGASATTVDRAYANSIGLTGGQKLKAYGAGGVVDAEIIPNVTMEVGGMRFDKTTVAVMDLEPIAHALGRPLNVVLGREFFNTAVVSIDWAQSRLEVSSHAAFKPKVGATELALKKRGPFNTIEVSMAGLPPTEALFDLGNGGALNLPQTYWGAHPELSGLRFAESRAGGVGGLHVARAAMVPNVRLGGTTFAAVPATLGEGGNNHDPEKMANVGIGLLKQFRIDLDLGRNRVFLRPRSDAPAFDRDRSGTRLELHGDKLKVAFVSPQGPAAEVGLKEGDEIVAVDGRQVTADYYKNADWTRGEPGKPVLLRKADGREVTVTLRDYY